MSFLGPMDLGASLDAFCLPHLALADADRARLLAIIFIRGESCNQELESLTGFLPSKISRHLALLHEAGWLKRRRQGTWIYYRISTELETEAIAWLRPRLEQLASQNTDSLITRPIPPLEPAGGEENSPLAGLQSHLL